MNEFEQAIVITQAGVLAQTAPLNAHSIFTGVSLKKLTQSDCFSVHIVKVEPFCTLETHTHPDNFEMHQVISGSGEVIIGKTVSNYTPGSIGMIPAGVSHKVYANAEGLYILAVFSPAL